MLRWRRLMARAGAALCAFALFAAAPASAVEEADLKAAIVYNLLLFVDWPADAVPAPGANLVLCLRPASAYAAALRALAARPLRGMQLELREIPAAAEIDKSCHVLLVEAAEPARLAALARLPKSASVLVIADTTDAAVDLVDAVAISLQGSDRKITFDVNLGAARRARLQLSSKPR